ncbi:hypothetical protein C2G38_2180856 [Gigaspora rosea]|uniref:Uncharacterized protein n=1 Tax=Gigaspora rosea TaxID=44941 RepID=A0A397VCT1_9GLOM|nr:hypothetical protein C2G38_2180856 [Gigaspora rosea]
MLTKALYHHQHRECAKRSAYSVNEAKKSIVGLCYTIAGLRNKFVNQYKLEVELYLMASGATWESVNKKAKLGYSACANTVEAYRKQVKKEHLAKIEKYFLENINVFYVYNIDDYHAIHENRRPDTVLTSTTNHFATCVAKPIVGCSSVPIVFNNISIHNPENVEALRICWYLINRYTGMFDISYLDCQLRKISQELQLMGFNEQHLHSVHDYINVLNLLLSINNKTQHLNGRVAPIVADWPSQIFIKKALYMRTQSDFLQQIESFLPILGPLHVSLNSREQVIIRYHLAQNGWTKIRDKILEKFGPTYKDIEYRTMIDLLDNLVPVTLDVYALTFRSGQFHEYVEKKFSKGRKKWKKKLPEKEKKKKKQKEKKGKKKKKRKKKKPPTTYRLATLDEDVDLRHLPMAYKRIEKGANTLTNEDLDDDDEDDIEGMEETIEEVEEALDIISKLLNDKRRWQEKIRNWSSKPPESKARSGIRMTNDDEETGIETTNGNGKNR